MDHLERQLAEEELSTAETRALLDRLAQEELGGSEMSTLKDVAEATGTPVDVLARMLADIRHVPEIKKKLDIHEQRLNRHERQLNSSNTTRNSSTYSQYKQYKEWEQQEERDKAAKALVPTFATILVVIIVISLVAQNAGPTPSSTYQGAVSRSATDPKTGNTYTATRNRVGGYSYTVTSPDGKVRPMTEQERQNNVHLEYGL